MYTEQQLLSFLWAWVCALHEQAPIFTKKGYKINYPEFFQDGRTVYIGKKTFYNSMQSFRPLSDLRITLYSKTQFVNLLADYSAAKLIPKYKAYPEGTQFIHFESGHQLYKPAEAYILLNVPQNKFSNEFLLLKVGYKTIPSGVCTSTGNKYPSKEAKNYQELEPLPYEDLIKIFVDAAYPNKTGISLQFRTAQKILGCSSIWREQWNIMHKMAEVKNTSAENPLETHNA